MVRRFPPLIDSLSMEIPYFEIPVGRDWEGASDFDRNVFSSNPRCQQFLRRCLPTELPPGQYEAMCGPEEDLFKLVVQLNNGVLSSALLAARAQSLEDFCSAIEKGAETLKIRGVIYERD